MCFCKDVIPEEKMHHPPLSPPGISADVIMGESYGKMVGGKKKTCKEEERLLKIKGK
jgi:hypothetical protein